MMQFIFVIANAFWLKLIKYRYQCDLGKYIMYDLVIVYLILQYHRVRNQKS